LPIRATEQLRLARKTWARLGAELRRTPTLGEVAAELELPEQDVGVILRRGIDPVSLSEPLSADSDAEVADVVADRSAALAVEAAATALLPSEVARLLAPLRAREREILTLRFGLDGGEPRTLEQVGGHFNLTRERIRQLEARAMCKLRHPAFNTPDAT
jgi:DNA-directed RNA polymerase sigma subunit (sigma70/sigma32)